MPPTIRYGLDCFSEASKSWTCECQRLNPPTRELFFLAPKYICDCGKKFKGDFRISLDDIKINSYNLMGKIHYQTLPRCVAYAYVHALQVLERKEAILMKRDPSLLADLDPNKLYGMLDSRFFDMTKVGCPMTPFRDVKMVHLGLILKEVGLIDQGHEPNVHMVGDVTVIPKDDFEGITTALARGEALVTTFYSGKRLNKLKYGQIYKSYRPSNYRSNKKKKIVGHAVCLVGAGREKGEEYLEFVNSHRRFCRRRNSHKKILMSGIGRIRASDLKSNVIRLSRVAADGEDEWRLQPQNEIVLNKHNRQLMNRLKPLQIGETLDIDKPSEMVDNLDIDDEMAAEDLNGSMKEPHDQVLVELKPHVPRDRLPRKGIKIRKWFEWLW